MSSLLNHFLWLFQSVLSQMLWHRLKEDEWNTKWNETLGEFFIVQEWIVGLFTWMVERKLSSLTGEIQNPSLSNFLSSQYEPLLWPVAKVLLGSNLPVEFLLRFHLESSTCMFPLWFGCITIPAVSTQFFRVWPTNVLRDGETLCVHGMCDTKVRPQPGEGRSWESAGSKTLSATELRCHRQQPALISPATLQRAAPH